MPSDEQPLPLQIIAVCHLAGSDEAEGASRLLQSLAAAVRNVTSRSAKYSLALVVLGDGVPDLETGRQYWPRIRLQTTTYGGAVTEHDRLIEACQTIIVALATSELLRAIDHTIPLEKRPAGWIWMGASALVVELTRMREFVRLLILRDTIRRVTGTELTFASEQRLANEMKDGVERFQSATLMRALAIASRFSWDGKADRRHVRELTLNHDAELRAKIYPPSSDLSSLLAARYATLRDALIENLAQTENEQYERLLDIFAFLLDRRIAGNRGKGGALSLQEPWPSGLPAAIHAIESATDELKNSPDIYFNGKAMPAHPIGDDYFLTTVGESDASAVYADFRRHTRFVRTISSPLGLLLKLLPGWPLLTGILTVITQWGVGRAALVAGSSLVAIGLIETAIWRILASKRLENLQNSIMRSLVALASPHSLDSF